LRLKDFDYTQHGAYFVTIVTRDRSLRFGDVANGEMQPNDAGYMVCAVWDELPMFYTGIQIDEFVVMPNHIHGIIVLVGAGPCACPVSSQPVPGTSEPLGSTPDDLFHPTSEGPSSLVDGPMLGTRYETGTGQARGPAPTDMTGMSVGDVVHRFKTMTTKRYADAVRLLGWPAFRGRLWQRNYYEHIVRDDAAMERIRRYIGDNASRWAEDEENPLGGKS
jgi:REP element-mobilizing transposase RayT